MSFLCAKANREAEARLQQVTMQQANSTSSYSGRAKFGICKATVLAAEIHHEPELPEGPYTAEQGNQPILVGVPRDLTYEDLTVGSWGGALPP